VLPSSSAPASFAIVEALLTSEQDLGDAHGSEAFKAVHLHALADAITVSFIALDFAMKVNVRL